MKRRNMREVRRCTGGEKQVADIVPAAATEAAIREAFDAWLDESDHNVLILSIADDAWQGIAYEAALAAYAAALAAAAPVIAAQATTAERERWIAADDGTASVYHLGRHDERERIRQLAIDVEAWFMDAQPQPPSFGVVEVEREFADLLGGDL